MTRAIFYMHQTSGACAASNGEDCDGVMILDSEVSSELPPMISKTNAMWSVPPIEKLLWTNLFAQVNNWACTNEMNARSQVALMNFNGGRDLEQKTTKDKSKCYSTSFFKNDGRDQQ